MKRPRIETFDLNLLRIFDALYQHRSVNAAAAEINLSPSAISHALARLRISFDDDLFVRGADGMSPTACAAGLANDVATVLLQVRTLLGSEEFVPETSSRQFRFRAHHYINSLILPPVVSLMRKSAPGVGITVSSKTTRGVADELDAGVIDLVIGEFGELPARFEYEVLFRDRWVWILREDHPAFSPDLKPEQFLDLPQVVIATADVEESIDGAVSEAGVQRNTVKKMFVDEQTSNSRYNSQVKGAVIVDGSLAVPEIVARSDVAALVPQRLVYGREKAFGIRAFCFDGPDFTYEHRLIWHRKHGCDPGTDWLKSLFRTAASSLPRID